MTAGTLAGPARKRRSMTASGGARIRTMEEFMARLAEILGPKAQAASRRKAPLEAAGFHRSSAQRCPVPGCQSRAAPLLVLVCPEHRNVPKAAIKKHREARRPAHRQSS